MPFKSEFIEHCNTITHKLTQPTEDIILARNARLRQNQGIINDLGHKSEGGTWGRLMANVPLILWNKAIKDGYDLDSKDKEIRDSERIRYLTTTVEGRACLVCDDTVKSATKFFAGH